MLLSYWTIMDIFLDYNGLYKLLLVNTVSNVVFLTLAGCRAPWQVGDHACFGLGDPWPSCDPRGLNGASIWSPRVKNHSKPTGFTNFVFVYIFGLLRFQTHYPGMKRVKSVSPPKFRAFRWFIDVRVTRADAERMWTYHAASCHPTKSVEGHEEFSSELGKASDETPVQFLEISLVFIDAKFFHHFCDNQMSQQKSKRTINFTNFSWAQKDRWPPQFAMGRRGSPRPTGSLRSVLQGASETVGKWVEKNESPTTYEETSFLLKKHLCLIYEDHTVDFL